MALPYTKVNWQDGVTPENASTLGKMDQGIKDLDDALAGKQAISEKGQVNGYASLDATGKVPLVQLPPISGGGIEYENVWAGATAYQAGDVVVYNGVTYLAVNPSTGQTPGAASLGGIGTNLPASPTDGMEFTLVDSLTAPTYAWKFRYLAAKATNRWLFVGGGPAYAEVPTSETMAVAAYGNLATVGPSLVVPVAGDYMVGIGFNGNTSVGGAGVLMSYDIGGTAAAEVDRVGAVNFTASTDGAAGLVSFERTKRKSLGAVTLVAKYRRSGTSGTSTFEERRMTLLPVAVGG